MSFSVHPRDARLKCLSMQQVEWLAALHARPLQFSGALPSGLPGSAEARAPAPEPAPVLHHHQAPSLQLPPCSSPTSEQEADLVKRLASLEATVRTMQEQLTQLALALLSERSLRFEQRVGELETLLQQVRGAHPPAPATHEHRGMPAPSLAHPHGQQRLQPAPPRGQRPTIPLVEYGARGTYVVICPQEGELDLLPDSPAWFAWLETITSFRFVGQSGRFTAYRTSKHRSRTRSWRAIRTIHGHNYKHHMGVADHLSIAHLEQMAARLQAYMTAL